MTHFWIPSTSIGKTTSPHVRGGHRNRSHQARPNPPLGSVLGGLVVCPPSRICAKRRPTHRYSWITAIVLLFRYLSRSGHDDRSWFSIGRRAKFRTHCKMMLVLFAAVGNYSDSPNRLPTAVMQLAAIRSKYDLAKSRSLRSCGRTLCCAVADVMICDPLTATNDPPQWRHPTHSPAQRDEMMVGRPQISHDCWKVSSFELPCCASKRNMATPPCSANARQHRRSWLRRRPR